MIPNFSRSLLKQLGSSNPALSAVIESAVKFSLPDEGKFLETDSLSAIESIEEIRLPFKCISLESVIAGIPSIFLCEEACDEIIAITYAKLEGSWVDLGIKTSIGMVGAVSGKKINIGYEIHDGSSVTAGDKTTAQISAYTILHFLNALACSNVEIKNVGRSNTKTGKSHHDAIRFDEYHVLTINSTSKTHSDSNGNSSHRSPREHLRRGHIRRLEDGRRIWINATVINAGIGSRVTKRYQLKGK